MPYAPKKPCAFPGCPELTHNRFCAVHAREYSRTIDERRGTPVERGYDAKWRQARKAFLKENPVCRM